MGANRNEFIENASKILLSKSEEYKCIIDKIEHYLNELLEDVKGITISGRSKDANNIAEKIYRKNYMMKYNDAAKFIEELPDGIGVRIICLLNQDEVKIYKHLIDRMPDERRSRSDIDKMGIFSFAQKINQRSKKTILTYIEWIVYGLKMKNK